MAVIKRQWRTWLAVVGLLAGVFLLWDRKAYSHAGNLTINTVRTFASLDGSADDHDGVADGTLTIHGDLLIDTGGSITCNDPQPPFDPGESANQGGCAIKIVAAFAGAGDMEMKAGSSITSENTYDGGPGGDISITVAGNLTLRGPSATDPGAIITSRKDCLGGPCGTAKGGNIKLVVGGVTLDESVYPAVGVCNTPEGDVLIEKGATITSDSVNGHAGDIAVYAGHNITVDGRVSAEGFTGGGQGGAITLDACCSLFVEDDGVVTSQGRDPGPDRVHLEGCLVEIRGLVQSTGPAHEPANQPKCQPPIRPGKPPNSSACVEIWSGTSVLIDSTGTNHGQVNADTALSGGIQGHGWIDILANLDILINDGTGDDHTQDLVGGGSQPVVHAVHANQYLGNGFGGDIDVQSKSGKVSTFGNAIEANDTINGAHGGKVTVEAGGAGAAGDVAFDAASIQAKGSLSGSAPSGGAISARSWNGGVTGGPGGELNASGDAAASPGSVTLEGCSGVTYTGTSTPPFVLGPNNLVCGGNPVFPALTPPEAYPSGDCVEFCTPATPTPTPTNTPTPTPTPGVFCPEDPNSVLTHTVIPSQPQAGNNYQTVQAAYDAAPNGSVIGLFSQTVENLTLGGAKTLKITQCTNARVTGVTGVAAPVWDVSSTGKLTIVGPDSVGGTIGWRVSNGPHTIKGLRATAGSLTQYGVLVVSNGNSVSWNSISGGPVGLRVEGASNTLTGGTISGASGDGAQIVGNGNTFQVSNVGPNGGNGILVSGSSNTIKDGGRVDLNGLNGVLVTGGSNTIKNIAAGSDATKGNGTANTFNPAGIPPVYIAGINVTGTGNTLDGDQTNANKGYGVFVSGTGTTIKNTQSNKGSSGGSKENTSAEYRFTVNLGSASNNKKDNVAFGSTAAGTYE